MSFEQLLSTNLINFLIVVSTLVLIFKKAHLGDLINKMANDVQSKVEKSAQDAQSALKEYKKTKKEVRNTQTLQQEILDNAEINAKNLKEKAETKTKTQQEEIKSNIEKIFEAQNDKYKKKTVNEIYCACVDLAKEAILNKLDEKTQRKLIDNSIEELENLEGNLS